MHFMNGIIRNGTFQRFGGKLVQTFQQEVVVPRVVMEETKK